MKSRWLYLGLTLALAAAPALAQGLFEQTADWDREDGTKVPGEFSVEGEGESAVYTVRGNGDDIWGTVDEGFYLYTERTGNWSIQGRIEWIDIGGSNDWAKAGIMIRENPDDASSRNVFGLLRGALDLSRFASRAATGSNTSNGDIRKEDGSELTAEDNALYRLSRFEDFIWGEFSLDGGATWTHAFTTQHDGLADSIGYGLTVTNHEANDQLGEAEFTDVQINEVTELPDFVISQEELGIFTAHGDFGGFVNRGSASFADGTYTVEGSGFDIWDTGGAYHFVYKEMSGAFEATADEVFITIPSSSDWNKSGLMVRDSLNHSSANGFALIRQDDQKVMQTRSQTGEATSNTGLEPFDDFPNSQLRIRKIGNLVQVFFFDGSEWVLEGESIIEMSDPVYFGLATTSHDITVTNVVEVSGLQVTEFPFQVLRNVGANSFAPGQSIPVTVTVDVREGESVGSLEIVEDVPDNGSVANISNGGELADGVITWSLSEVSADQELSYTFNAPSDPSIVRVNWGASTSSSAEFELPVAGTNQLNVNIFDAWEAFTFPAGGDGLENEGASLADMGGGIGWNGVWTVGEGENITLNTTMVESGIVQSQPQEFNPGNFSAQLTGEVNIGAARSFPTVSSGELWLSFTFFDEGPAEEHWAGVTLFNESGEEVSFVGKPFNAEFAGIGNLPGGDQLVDGVNFQEPQHYLVRYQLRGDESLVSLWVNPDSEDRQDTYDVQGVDSINNIAEIRLRRGTGDGSAFFDNIWLSTVVALPAPNSGRVDLTLSNPDRPPEIPAWDVVSIDQIDDAITGVPGFGHDVGNDFYLVVAGHIYFDAAGNAVVSEGLPFDRISGLNGHMFGPYNNQFEELNLKNSVKLMNNEDQSGPFTFDVVPPGQYTELRSILEVGNGDGQMFATLIYDDGTTEDGFINSDDWFNDPPDLNFPENSQFIDGMDRLEGADSVFADVNDPAIFEHTLPVDPEKTLTQLSLEYDPSVDDNAAINVYDILAIPAAGPDTPVSSWSLY